MSDPSVYQQYGMVVGIPNAGQVNALEVAQHPRRAFGHLQGQVRCPAGHAAAGRRARGLRGVPQAARMRSKRAAALDAKYGRNPDLKAMPLYCVAMANKGIYDAKDMRTTGGADVNYAMDAPPKDSTLVAAAARRPARSSMRRRTSPSTTAAAATRAATQGGAPYIGQGGSRESWGGMTCNPYDTERVTSGLERRLGRRRRGQSRDVLDLRNHGRILPRPG